METNYLALLLSALSTLFVGFVWYHPKVFGALWMKESGLTESKMKSGNMILIFGMAVIFAFLISVMLQFLVIHQWAVLSAAGGDPTITLPSYAAFMKDYGHTFRTFPHGMLHGFMSGLFLGLPIVGINALFERKSWKYILVNGGFWMVSMMLMGGIICAMK